MMHLDEAFHAGQERVAPKKEHLSSSLNLSVEILIHTLYYLILNPSNIFLASLTLSFGKLELICWYKTSFIVLY